MLFDQRSGRIMNPSLAEYHVPVHLDVPPIDVIWTDIPDPLAPLGPHGIGEIGITGCAAAIANAVYNAAGKRIRELRSRWTRCWQPRRRRGRTGYRTCESRALLRPHCAELRSRRLNRQVCRTSVHHPGTVRLA
jgi:hypothetical protein